MSERASAEHGETDWRRLASDRNVSHAVARALWEQAHEASPDDPAQAAHVYHAMLEEAARANVSPEPGRETLAGSHGARDASTLGPGKWTRVLLEQPKAAAPPAANAKPSASRVRDELLAAGQATQRATAMLADSDAATIVEALRELTARQGADVVKKVLAMAGGAVERALNARPAGAQAAPASTTTANAATANAATANAATTNAATANAANAANAAPAARATPSPRGTPSAAPANTARGTSPGPDRKR